jgi:hypothetical protein
LGLVPLKIVKADPPAGTGAGAGKVSPVPRFVGLNVPVLKREEGRLLAAASSRVRVTFVTSSAPPTSDIMMAFCPPGPTNRMSMSEGKVWARLLSFTVTFVTVPPKPATDMFDG